MSLTEADVQDALNLIDTISQDANAMPFLEPVDWKGLGLDDYPQIVKNPMDLGTVSENLKAGNFATFEACFTDI